MSELDLLTQLGNDVIAAKYFGLANCAILFYDYFLTLADEIKYVWPGKKSLTLWLFFANRYFPMSYQFWVLATSFTSSLNMKVCNRSAWYSIFVFIVCTPLAQVVLTLRIYAVAKKNIRIAIGLAVVTCSQLVFGIYLLVLGIRAGAQPLPPIPLDPYVLCAFVLRSDLLLAYTSISLFYDSLAFSLMVFLAKNSMPPGFKIPGLIRAIAEDTMRYFLVIFTAHFVFVMTLSLGQGPIKLLPGTGVVVYLPVMISRIMLSLRKVAASQQHWSIGEPTDLETIRFLRPRRDPDETGTEIPLSTLPRSQTTTQ